MREEWYNIEKNTIDMKKMNATDLPFNSRTYLPHALDESTEIEMHVVKQRVKAVSEKYKADNKRSVKNLTEAQFQGIKSLREKRENGEIVVYQTSQLRWQWTHQRIMSHAWHHTLRMIQQSVRKTMKESRKPSMHMLSVG